MASILQESDNQRAQARAEERTTSLRESNTSLVSRMADLVREGAQMEKVCSSLLLDSPLR